MVFSVIDIAYYISSLLNNYFYIFDKLHEDISVLSIFDSSKILVENVDKFKKIQSIKSKKEFVNT